MEQPEDYGKFKSADELMSAYNALEAEFTKRSQLIKQLQAELDELRAAPPRPIDDGTDGDVCERGAQAEESITENAAEQADGVTAVEATAERVVEPMPVAPAPSLSDSDIVDAIAADAARFAVLLAGIPQIMDACVAKYKQKLIGLADASPVISGRAVLTPPKRPRTLADAKRLADEMLGSI